MSLSKQYQPVCYPHRATKNQIVIVASRNRLGSHATCKPMTCDLADVHPSASMETPIQGTHSCRNGPCPVFGRVEGIKTAVSLRLGQFATRSA